MEHNEKLWNMTEMEALDLQIKSMKVMREARQDLLDAKDNFEKAEERLLKAKKRESNTTHWASEADQDAYKVRNKRECLYDPANRVKTN